MLRLMIAAAYCWLAGVGTVTAGDPELGARLYRQGLSHDGSAVIARGVGDVRFFGTEMTCARCHRRSGFGGVEGGYFIPPVSAGFLFEPRRLERTDRFRALFLQGQSGILRSRIRQPRMRPAYDEASLGMMLREGTDPGGNRFEDMMPRYELDDRDVANLTAYLRTLSAEISPGVDDTHVHLAVVIDGGADAGPAEAVIETMRAFEDWYNRRTMGNLARAGHSVYGGSQFLETIRLFKLHVWTLEGEPGQWRDQLDAYLAGTPVFALVGGYVPHDWRPVGAFCDAEGIPCIFPITEVPNTSRELGGYSIHFSRGLELEADLAAHYLVKAAGEDARVVQWYANEPAGRMPAERLAGRARVAESRPFADGADLEALIEALERRERPDVLVVWPGSRQPDVDQKLERIAATGLRILLPSAAARAEDAVMADELKGRIFYTYPYALADSQYPEVFRTRAWMNTRGLDYSSEHYQFRAYYAMSMFRDAFSHMRGYLFRDFLVELLEHEIEGSANPGIYPLMALGPEQRFASKSGYVVRRGEDGGLEDVSGRMVP